MEVNQYAQEIKKTHPDFKIALGNEIYLIDERHPGQKYYHFILIAKDAIGHKALRELSSIAWYNSYMDRGLERVPITKEELKNVINKYKGHVIATTACIGGEVSQNALFMSETEAVNDMKSAAIAYNNIIKLVNFCIDLFGDDFYIECAPGTSREQKIVNAKLFNIAKAFNLKMVIGTDAHYLNKQDRFVHKAYLNSKGGEREVDAFYEFTYVMDYEEASSLLSESFNGDRSISDRILDNTLEIQNKIQDYSLERKQIIPKVEVKEYPRYATPDIKESHPILYDLMTSENVQERYWANECYISLLEKEYNKQIDDTKHQEYLDRLETEADVIKCIGEKLDDCLFAYFNTFKHYIDLFWECGSIVGPGRGSATGFLSNYLLGITQLDPVRWKLPYWRLTC